MDNSKQMIGYIGVKAIKATPMTRKEYNDYRGWDLPSDEDGTDEGYLVEYEQSLETPNINHPDHLGYISWSPKDVFNEAYVQVEGISHIDHDPNQPEYMSRVVLEANELGIKVVKLREFFLTDIFVQLSNSEQQRMFNQEKAMTAYWIILKERIDAIG